jgi:uncharacterized protein with FMN-binding domain
MRRAITTLFVAAVLSLPVVDAAAAMKAATRKVVVTKTFTGSTAQSAGIDFVSGATDTSDGYTQSLQSAILKAKRA